MEPSQSHRDFFPEIRKDDTGGAKVHHGSDLMKTAANLVTVIEDRVSKLLQVVSTGDASRGFTRRLDGR